MLGHFIALILLTQPARVEHSKKPEHTRNKQSTIKCGKANDRLQDR